jgi:YcxB-like protein
MTAGADTPPVTVTTHLTEDEFLRGCHDLWATDGIGPRGNLIAAGGLGLAGVVLALAGIRIGWLVAGAALVVGLLSLLRDRNWRRYHRTSGRFAAPTTSVFTDAGIRVAGPLGTREVPWAAFRSHAETGRFRFLIVNNRQFSVLPKASIPPADQAALRAMIARHLPAKRRRFL